MNIRQRELMVHADSGRTPAPSDTGTEHVGSGIARMRGGQALTTRDLEAKRLVHAEREDLRSTDVFREFRSRLLSVAGQRNPILLVCGVRRQVGASFVARNLAASIAMDSERTALLIDCHWRQPSQHQVFEIGNGPGLSDYLRKPGMAPEAIIYRTGIPRLRLIPAGAALPSDADKLCSLRMRALLGALSERYDDRCIILDAPPARGSPEAHLLAQRADLVVLVAGEGMHRSEDVLAAAATFEPAKLAGVVFNEMP